MEKLKNMVTFFQIRIPCNRFSFTYLQHMFILVPPVYISFLRYNFRLSLARVCVCVGGGGGGGGGYLHFVFRKTSEIDSLQNCQHTASNNIAVNSLLNA